MAQFKDYWLQLVHDSRFTPNFSLPFYHMKSEGFWFLHTFIGKEIALTSSRSIKSFGHLKDVVDFASFDETLYEFLLSADSRELIRSTLLHVYFHDAHISADNKIIAEISNQIVNEPAAVYKIRAEQFDEEEVFGEVGFSKKKFPGFIIIPVVFRG